jgi:hypothetical protein
MEPVQLSADELRLWLGLHERELADAALNDPLVWSLYASVYMLACKPLSAENTFLHTTPDNKVRFIESFLERHGFSHGEDHDSHRIIAEAAGRL